MPSLHQIFVGTRFLGQSGGRCALPCHSRSLPAPRGWGAQHAEPLPVSCIDSPGRLLPAAAPRGRVSPEWDRTLGNRKHVGF